MSRRCNGLDHQKWTYDSDAAALRYQADTSKCVDLTGGDTTDGTRLQIWDCNGLDNQKWGYDGNLRTLYYLSSSANHPDASKCLDLAGGVGYNGANVQIWDCNGHTNQQWALS
jgi:hypothetical protein